MATFFGAKALMITFSSLSSLAMVSQACAFSFEIPGTNTSVHVGEGGPPVRQHGPVFKSPGEILGDAAAGAVCGALCVAAFNKMSPQDRANVTSALTTGGLVVLTASDPLLGITLALLTSKDDAGGHNVNIQEKDSPPTGKSWTVSVDCIVQRKNGDIVAFSKAEYQHHGEILRGDKVSLTAPMCPQYDGDTSKSVTSISIQIRGLSTDDLAKPGDTKYYLSGAPA
jgi:hypothetical protein